MLEPKSEKTLIKNSLIEHVLLKQPKSNIFFLSFFSKAARQFLVINTNSSSSLNLPLVTRDLSRILHNKNFELAFKEV